MVDVAFAAQGFPQTSQYRMAFSANPEQLSLVNWFRRNIDVDGTILESGGYSLQTLTNGVEVLSVTGDVPEDYGPLAGMYAMPPSHTMAISIATSQTNQLDLIGISAEVRKRSYLSM